MTKTDLIKLLAKSGFKSSKIFNKYIASPEASKSKLGLNRPMYVGFLILELFKVFMYDFHYNSIKEKCGNRVAHCFTDTVSSCYDTTEDVYMCA